MVSLILLLILTSSGFKCAIGYNDFPSLMTANATMAVIIEKGFFTDADDYRKTLMQISEIITGVVRRHVKVSGVGVQVFGDADINLARDYTVLLSVATCQSTWRLFKRAQKEKLVYLAITDPDCPRLPEDAGVSLPLIVPGEELPQIFLDLRMSNTLAWPKVNFIYDDTFARDTVSRVVKALSMELPDGRLTLSARALFSTKFDMDESAMRIRVHKILSNYHVDQLGSCFMVIVTVSMVPVVMEVAKSLKMVNPAAQWLYIVNDAAGKQEKIDRLAQLLGEGENIAFVHNATQLGAECQMGLMCHVKELVRALAVSLENSLLSELELYDRVTEEEFEVVRLSKAERRSEIIKSVKRELTRARTEHTGNGCSECIAWRLTSAITWGASFDRFNESSASRRHQQQAGDDAIDRLGVDNAGGKLIVSGAWSPGPGVNMTEPLFPHVSHGFRGKLLPVSTFHNPPWQIIKYSSEGEQREYGGLIFDILNHLSRKLNFTYTVQLARGLVAKPTPRLLRDNNSSSGRSKDLDEASISVAQRAPPEVLELVRTRKVFLAAAAFTVAENTRGVNFTAAVATQTYTLLSSKPMSLSRALLFMAPFTSETWACLTSTMILIGPVLYLTVKLSPRPPDEYDPGVAGLSTTWQCSWYVYGALLQQGGMCLPKADSARLIVGTWWLVVMVVVATYSGNLIAFLTFPRVDAPLDSVDDLLARGGDFTWAFPNGSALESYLRAAANDDDKYKQLLDGAERQDPTMARQVLERIKSRNHVLIDWRISVAFLMRSDLIDTGDCHFHVSAEDFMHEDMAMMIVGDSPYLPLINDAIKRMHESGLIKKWTVEKMPMKDKCWEGMKMSQEATNHKVDMGDMQGIFFLLAIGFTIAAIVIIAEFAWHQRKLAREKNLVRPFVS